MELSKDICGFLEGKGIGCSVESAGAFEVITACLEDGRTRAVLPVRIMAKDMSEAEAQQMELQKTVSSLTGRHGSYPLIITEDRWGVQKEMMQKRLLSHLEIFFPIYARNCEVRRIEKAEAAAFLGACHSYGDAACRYRYGLYLKRHTGHIANGDRVSAYAPGTLVAVATFSNARKWIKGEKVIRSYEWTRYASLPELRISGGMGKLLKAFIQDVHPDDIMSYADLEWSEGKVYEQLGFSLDGEKGPVTFYIDSGYRRLPLKPSTGMSDLNVIADSAGNLIFSNPGSRKYRLKLTEY